MQSAGGRFRFYKGNAVKRMRRGPHGIILTLLSSAKGVAGQQITISQADWDQYGEWRDVARSRKNDLREFASKQPGIVPGFLFYGSFSWGTR